MLFILNNGVVLYSGGGMNEDSYDINNHSCIQC